MDIFGQFTGAEQRIHNLLKKEMTCEPGIQVKSDFSDCYDEIVPFFCNEEPISGIFLEVGHQLLHEADKAIVSACLKVKVDPAALAETGRTNRKLMWENEKLCNEKRDAIKKLHDQLDIDCCQAVRTLKRYCQEHTDCEGCLMFWNCQQSAGIHDWHDPQEPEEE